MTEPSWSREPSEGDRTLEENWLFRLRRERFRSRRTELAHDFFVLRLADAVNVIALTPDRQLILVRQFRAGSGRDSLETPGGLLDPGEDPATAGARELLEETGYAGDPPIVLGSVWSNPSLMSSRTTTIVITNARPKAEPSLDHGEEVVVTTVPARKVPGLIRDGQIDHALTVQGLLWWLVAEIPHSPILPEVRRQPSRRIGYVVLLALVLASQAASAGSGKFVAALGAAVALPLAVVLTLLYLDPPTHSILLQRWSSGPRRLILRGAAVLGLTVLLVVWVLNLAKPG